MAQRTALPAETARVAAAFARGMTIGVRSWSFYPPEHPAVAVAVERLVGAAADACSQGLLPIAVTPHALLVHGVTLESGDQSVTECAELLHDRDILQITVAAPPTDALIRSLLTVLTLDRDTRRARGGPAAIWAEADQHALLIEQIDYQQILEREADEGPARKDAMWKSIVRSVIMGHSTFTAEEQARLLEISGDVGAIGELCKDAREPFTMPDGSPMVTTQAATVMAVYHHIAKTVTALEPDRAAGVVDSLALAAGQLDPGTAMEMLLPQAHAEDRAPFVAALKQAFDDQQVALLLARALSAPGQATSRLARVLDTLAPDHERKQRVLALARKLISERDFGSKRPVDDIRQSLDELLLKYDETQYVSKDYRESMDVAAGRAGDLSARGLPPEMSEWLDTLGADSVRRLSGQLLIDLLRNETMAGRMSDTANDMAGFAEELLLAGVYDECLPVVAELAAAAKRQLAPDACRHAIDTIAASGAFAEAAAGLAEQSAAEFAAFEKVVVAIGSAAVPAIVATYQREDTASTPRATALLCRLGPAAIPALAEGLDERPWLTQREIARALGKIGTSAAVPPLQSLLRRTDTRVLQAAVAALSSINDPAARRALHTVLKASSGEARAAVIAALVALRDASVVPMLVRVLQDCRPFGDEHGLLIDTLSALGTLKDDRAVMPIAALTRHRRWWAWGKTTQLRRAALDALSRIGSTQSKEAMAGLARTGDFFMRRMAARAL
jgi:HEAT repeat protein